MAKILFIGDPHLKINRFELATKFLYWLNQLIAEKRPDIVVNLGDTFDTHAVLRSEVMNEFMSHVDFVNSLNIDYVYLLGNHDMYKPNDAKYHAMRPFKNRNKKLHIIDKPTELFGMSFVPYQHDPNAFPRDLLPICIAHQTFFGADYGPVIAKDGVTPDSLRNCEIVISGHIHKRQILESTGAASAQIIYVGSPFAQSASDTDQTKGITIFDTATYAQEFIETPLPQYRKIKITLCDYENIDAIHGSICNYINNTKDHWILELEGSKPEIVGYLSSDRYKALVKDIDIKIKTVFTDKEKKKISIEASTMDSIISDYINKIYNGSLDKRILLETAKTILDKSRVNP